MDRIADRLTSNRLGSKRMSKDTTHFSATTDHMMLCPCCKKGGFESALLIVLEVIRANFDAPVTIHSGSRCTKHNASVGGAPKSQHLVNDDILESDAADISVEGISTKQLHLFVKSLPFANLLGIGYYPNNGFVHVDTRGYAARWQG